MIKRCVFCRKKINPLRITSYKVKYCSRKCSQLAYYYRNRKAKAEYTKEYQLKNFERDKDKKKIQMKNWYNKNKTRQKKNVLRNYHKNKAKWRERKNTHIHREEIFFTLQNICSNCGKTEVKIIHHQIYGKYPKRIKGDREVNKQRRIEYYKKYLLLFCSKSCHREYERKMRKGKVL